MESIVMDKDAAAINEDIGMEWIEFRRFRLVQ